MSSVGVEVGSKEKEHLVEHSQAELEDAARRALRIANYKVGYVIRVYDEDIAKMIRDTVSPGSDGVAMFEAMLLLNLKNEMKKHVSLRDITVSAIKSLGATYRQI